MPGIDMPGEDLSVTDVEYTDPHLCQAACNATHACKGFTYVVRGARAAELSALAQTPRTARRAAGRG